MNVPVVQVLSITLESLKYNTLVDHINEHFDQKTFTLIEKLGCNFSNTVRLDELKDKVTSEKIHGFIEFQIKLRKRGHYDTTLSLGWDSYRRSILNFSAKARK